MATAKQGHLATILSGNDGNFRWSLHPSREQAIRLKQTRLTKKEKQLMMDIAAIFDADFDLNDLPEVSLELDPTQRRVALQCAQKGLAKVDGLLFTLSSLGASWIAVNCPELTNETMALVPSYRRGHVMPEL